LKVFSVVGITKTGKTSTIENIIGELRRRRYTVGSVKDIHFEKFAIDTEGTNTHRHSVAGAEPVTARGLFETDFLHKKRLPMAEILAHYDTDFVVLEGVEDFAVPRIVTAANEQDMNGKIDDTAFAVSGKIAAHNEQLCGLPAIDATTDVQMLVDLIEQKTFEPLPNLPTHCCGVCGSSCYEMIALILEGERVPEDCPVRTELEVQLHIGDEKIDMVPFVQKLLKNAVIGVVSELDGYKDNAPIKVRIDQNDPR